MFDLDQTSALGTRIRFCYDVLMIDFVIGDLIDNARTDTVLHESPFSFHSFYSLESLDF